LFPLHLGWQVDAVIVALRLCCASEAAAGLSARVKIRRWWTLHGVRTLSELGRAVAEGDAERFTAMYVMYYPRVLSYASRRIAADSARDVADEVFVVAWRRRGQPRAAELPWLLVTTRNVIGQTLRLKRREDVLRIELTNLQATPGDVGDVSEGVLERMKVLQALTFLSPNDREALMLTVWDGLSTRDAAVVSGCSTTAFGVRLHRARRRLADAMAQADILDKRPPSPATAPLAVRPPAFRSPRYPTSEDS